MGRRKMDSDKKEKLRNISIRDELWIPFFEKYNNCSKKIREWIKKDLEGGNNIDKGREV